MKEIYTACVNKGGEKTEKMLKASFLQRIYLCTPVIILEKWYAPFWTKTKARKRAKKQYKKILKNPRLLAEKKHKDSWRKRVHRAYHGVFKRWKKKKSDETRILLGATTLRKELE